MQPISLATIATAVGALAYQADDLAITITSVEFDSRRVTPGALFVPLTGGATDGHDYIQQAIANGAVATLWQESTPNIPDDELAVLVVEDTLVAMQQLAAHYRQMIDPIVIGITGSNGKTTTKDMTKMTLQAKYQVHATVGNYNNEIGLPYTILQMPAETEVLVLEMGMSDFGEIAALTRIAKPNIAAITLIGESHLEFLETRAGIAQAKMEITQSLAEDGLFIYPEAEPLLRSQLDQLAPTIQTCSFGWDDQADVYAYDLEEQLDRTYFRTSLDPEVRCMIPVLGQYNVANALIALSIAEFLAVPVEQAIFQLSQFELTKNRLEWMTTRQGARLLNDAYNASPTSMRAVLTSFSQLELPAEARRLAVLGDIRELGDESANYHRQLAASLSPDQIEQVYLFGPEMHALYTELQKIYPSEALFYESEDHQRLIAQLEQDLTADDVVVVKSSFGVDLLSVVSALVD